MASAEGEGRMLPPVVLRARLTVAIAALDGLAGGPHAESDFERALAEWWKVETFCDDQLWPMLIEALSLALGDRYDQLAILAALPLRSELAEARDGCR